MEEKIVKYLRSKYNPQAILLAGSRAEGREAVDSDWDIYVLTPEEHRGGFFEWNEALLDITFKDLPKEDGVLTNPYKPLSEVKVLFDGTNGALENVLKNTKAEYEKGPLLTAYAEKCSDRLRKLRRGVHKIKRYEDNAPVQFYYLTYNFYFLIQVWFEQQNLWPMPPAEALPYIEENDGEFFDLLESIRKSIGSKLTEHVKQAVAKVEKLQL